MPTGRGCCGGLLGCVKEKSVRILTYITLQHWLKDDNNNNNNNKYNNNKDNNNKDVVADMEVENVGTKEDPIFLPSINNLVLFDSILVDEVEEENFGTLVVPIFLPKIKTKHDLLLFDRIG